MKNRFFVWGVGAVIALAVVSQGCDPDDTDGAAGAGGAGAGGAGCVKTGPRCERPAEAPGGDVYLGAPIPGQCPVGDLCSIAAGAPKGDCVNSCSTPVGGAGGAGGAGGGGTGGAAGAGASTGVALCNDPTPSCTRPTDTALSAPYLGSLGELGCGLNTRCEVNEGDNQGKCVVQGCEKGKGDPAVPAMVNGSTLCNTPLEFSFEGKASEVYRFGATMSVPPTAAAGANVAGTLYLDGQAVQEAGVDVGIGGAPYPGSPVIGERWYSLRKPGSYKVRFTVEQCDLPVTVAGFVERKAEADPNLTKETAAPLALGVTAAGGLNCEEERWFVLTPAAGQTLRFTLTGLSALADTVGGASAAVLDGALQPLVEGGNDVSIGAEFKHDPPAVPGLRDVTFEQGGVHYLRMRFDNGCAISSYQLAVSTP